MIEKISDLTDEVQKQIIFAAERVAPQEMCGLILHDVKYQAYYPEFPFIQCENVADNPFLHFEIAAEEFLYFENKSMPVIAIVHSHPNGEPFLSGADRQMQVAGGLPWILAVSGSLKVFRPVPHLCGREFIYNQSDCCRLIQDAYHLCGLDLPDCLRLGLDEDIAAQTLLNYFQHNHEFNQVDDCQAGNIILTQSGKNTPEHALLYLGNGEILHHAHNHLSRIDFYSDYWQKHTHSVWRHQKWQPEMMAAIENDLLHCN